jgi:hypothetical protein
VIALVVALASDDLYYDLRTKALRGQEAIVLSFLFLILGRCTKLSRPQLISPLIFSLFKCFEKRG